MVLSYEPPFDFDHLIEVHPLLVSDSRDDVTLMVDSIERYAHGFVLIMWVKSESLRAPLLAISARDSHGHSYNGRMEAGYGSGDEKRGWRHRVVYSFKPALGESAGSLTLDVRPVRRLGYSAPRRLTVDPADLPGESHEFHVPLFEADGDSPRRCESLEQSARGPSGLSRPEFPPDMPSMSRNVAHGPGEHERTPCYGPDELVRVIPVAQHQEHGSFGMSIMSLELYHVSFLIVMRTDYPRPGVQLPLQLGWVAVDEIGGSYRSRGLAGSGGGHRHQTSSWRVDCHFTPSLDQRAQELHLRIDELRFNASGTTGSPNVPSESVTIKGPWEFSIPVSAASA